MSFLSTAASCPSVSRGSDRERPLADDIPIIDAENAEGSSRAVGPWPGFTWVNSSLAERFL